MMKSNMATQPKHVLKGKTSMFYNTIQTKLLEIISMINVIEGDSVSLSKLAEGIDALAKEIMPNEVHGSVKKHPENGRLGAKTEWQMRVILARNNSTDTGHSKINRQLKRKGEQVNEPSEKKVKRQSSDLSFDSFTTEAIPNSSQHSTATISTTRDKQEVQQPSGQRESILVVQGTMHQGDESFPGNTRGTQCMTNSFVFVLQNSISKIEKTSEMDTVLIQGDQLHSVFNRNLEREANTYMLNFDEIQASVKSILGEDENQCHFGPVHCGDILADEAQPPFFTLDQALNHSREATGALLRVGDYTTAVQVNKDDSVRVYDPHARDESGFFSRSGTSIVIDFKDMKSFISYIRLFVSSTGTGQTACHSNKTSSDSVTLRSFELLPLFVKSRKCLPTLLKKIDVPPKNPSSSSKTESREKHPQISGQPIRDLSGVTDRRGTSCKPSPLHTMVTGRSNTSRRYERLPTTTDVVEQLNEKLAKCTLHEAGVTDGLKESSKTPSDALAKKQPSHGDCFLKVQQPEEELENCPSHQASSHNWLFTETRSELEARVLSLEKKLEEEKAKHIKCEDDHPCHLRQELEKEKERYIVLEATNMRLHREKEEEKAKRIKCEAEAHRLRQELEAKESDSPGATEQLKEIQHTVVEKQLHQKRTLLRDQLSQHHDRRQQPQQQHHDQQQQQQQQQQQDTAKQALTGAYIEGKVAGKEFRLLVDTGASFSVIDKGKVDLSKMSESSYENLIPVSGDTCPILGEITLPVILGDNEYFCLFRIPQHSVVEVILGNDFLSEHRAVINLKEKTLSLERAGNRRTFRLILQAASVMGSFHPGKKNSKARRNNTKTCDSDSSPKQPVPGSR